MDQREHIEELLLKSDRQKMKSSAIQHAYEKYYASGSDRDFENLIAELDSYCISWVRKQLWKTGCYSDENEHTAMQEGRIAAWKVIEEDKKVEILRSDLHIMLLACTSIKCWIKYVNIRQIGKELRPCP